MRPLLLADHYAALLAEKREAAGHGGVVAKVPVAVQFDEALEAQVDEVQHVRPVRVARQLHPLPGREPAIELLALLFQVGDLLLAGGRLRGLRIVSQRRQLALDLNERLLEL